MASRLVLVIGDLFIPDRAPVSTPLLLLPFPLLTAIDSRRTSQTRCAYYAHTPSYQLSLTPSHSS